MRNRFALLDTLLYSNFFISLCAAAMAGETCLLHDMVPDPFLLILVFSATIVFYCLPSLFFARTAFSPNESERHLWIIRNRRILAGVFLTGVAGTAFSLLFLPWKLFFWLALVALPGFAYFMPATYLRKIPIVKAATVAMVWIGMTTFLPLLIIHDFQLKEVFSPDNEKIGLMNFLFVLPLCIIYNVRDIELDRKARVHTLPVLFGVFPTILLCLISLAGSAVVIRFSGFPVTLQCGLYASLLVTGIVISFASRDRRDSYYSLWVDGMILLQTLMISLLVYLGT